jgi:nucleotide-binding universal stress UspA family protein
MYHNILVAVDRFAHSSAVFEQALKLAKLSGAKLLLLHVLSRDEADYPLTRHVGIDEDYYKRWRVYMQEGLEHLNILEAQAQHEGVSAEVLQEIGRPGHIICETAKSRNVDLIVMGNRGRSGLSEMALGSHSNYVMHHARCSVLIHHLSELASNSLESEATA